MFQMAPSLSHEDALKLVCAVCCNLRGKKPTRGVSDKEEENIQTFVFSGYRRGSPFYPQGLCAGCQRALQRKAKEGGEDDDKKIQLVLPDDYFCQLPHQTRMRSQEDCDCRWCKLARLSRPGFKLWRMKIQEKNKSKPLVLRICQQYGNCLPATQVS